MVSPPHFDHEKLDVYQLELKFLTWVTQFLADLSGPSLAQTRELREQLDRASLDPEQYRVGESASGLAAPFEDEDDDEHEDEIENPRKKTNTGKIEL
jgi:hypothetical protein